MKSNSGGFASLKFIQIHNFSKISGFLFWRGSVVGLPMVRSFKPFWWLNLSDWNIHRLWFWNFTSVGHLSKHCSAGALIFSWGDMGWWPFVDAEWYSVPVIWFLKVKCLDAPPSTNTNHYHNAPSTCTPPFFGTPCFIFPWPSLPVPELERHTSIHFPRQASRITVGGSNCTVEKLQQPQAGRTFH